MLPRNDPCSISFQPRRNPCHLELILSRKASALQVTEPALASSANILQAIRSQLPCTLGFWRDQARTGGGTCLQVTVQPLLCDPYLCNCLVEPCNLKHLTKSHSDDTAPPSMNGHASQASVVAVTVTFTALSLCFVASRIYARLRVAKNAGLDDITIVFAMVFSVGVTITMLLQVKHGMGRRQASLSAEEAMTMLQAVGLRSGAQYAEVHIHCNETDISPSSTSPSGRTKTSISYD